MTYSDDQRAKTDATDQVLMNPGGDPDRRLDEVAPLPAGERGEVRVERDGKLEPLSTSDDDS